MRCTTMRRSRLTRADRDVDFRWTLNSPGRGLPFDWYSVRWTGSIVAPPGGVSRIAVEANDGYRLYLDGTLVIDNWRKQSYGTRSVAVTWAAQSTHRVKLEYFESTGIARVKLQWNAGVVNDAPARIREATERACSMFCDCT